MSEFVPSALLKHLSNTSMALRCREQTSAQASQMEAAISVPWRFFRTNCDRLMRHHLSTWARVSVLGRIARNPKKLSSLDRERGNFRDLQGRRIYHHAHRRTGHLGMAVPAWRQGQDRQNADAAGGASGQARSIQNRCRPPCGQIDRWQPTPLTGRFAVHLRATLLPRWLA